LDVLPEVYLISILLFQKFSVYLIRWIQWVQMWILFVQYYQKVIEKLHIWYIRWHETIANALWKDFLGNHSNWLKLW
jgi:hypothetical protein